MRSSRQRRTSAGGMCPVVCQCCTDGGLVVDSQEPEDEEDLKLIQEGKASPRGQIASAAVLSRHLRKARLAWRMAAWLGWRCCESSPGTDLCAWLILSKLRPARPVQVCLDELRCRDRERECHRLEVVSRISNTVRTAARGSQTGTGLVGA